MKDIKVGDFVKVTETDYIGKLRTVLLNNNCEVVKVLNDSTIIVKASVDTYKNDTWALTKLTDKYRKVKTVKA